MRNLLLIILLPVLLFSCDNKKTVPEILIGKWKIFDVDFPDKNITNDVKDEAKNLAHSVTYIFNEDFTYTIRSNKIPDGQSGIWKYNPYKETLLLTLNDDESSEVIVTFDVDNNLVFIFATQNYKVVYFLKRIQ